jgi:hypothetical protein
LGVQDEKLIWLSKMPLIQNCRGQNGYTDANDKTSVSAIAPPKEGYEILIHKSVTGEKIFEPEEAPKTD